MTTSTISNSDSPLWLKESTISTTYTFQEETGAETLPRYSENVFSDSRYGSSIIGVYLGLPHNAFYNEDLSDRDGDVFIWRNYMNDRPIRMFKTINGYYQPIEDNVILGPTFHKELEKMQKIYENNDVQGYYII
jgi:hypothetical protein